MCAEDYPICKAFTAEQVQQLATPTYRTSLYFHSTSTPTLVDAKDIKHLGQVEGGRVLEETPAGKKI